jgi:hypothetical protein
MSLAMRACQAQDVDVPTGEVCPESKKQRELQKYAKASKRYNTNLGAAFGVLRA